MSDLVLTTIIAVVMLIALAGVVIPVLPGLALIWGAALFYGFQVGFGPGGVVVMVVLSVLLAVSVGAGIVLPSRAAVESGASKRSQWAGLVGAVIGFFAIPVVGLVVGALAGVLIAEYGRTGDWAAARTATIGLAKGFGVSTLVQLALGVIMIGVWSIWAATVLF